MELIKLEKKISEKFEIRHDIIIYIFEAMPQKGTLYYNEDEPLYKRIKNFIEKNLSEVIITGDQINFSSLNKAKFNALISGKYGKHAKIDVGIWMVVNQNGFVEKLRVEHF